MSRLMYLSYASMSHNSSPTQWMVLMPLPLVASTISLPAMVAGVHGADEDIEVGDLVWIRDKEHGRPLALGWATMAGSDMVEATKGKGIKTIHWVGDELWDMEA